MFATVIFVVVFLVNTSSGRAGVIIDNFVMDPTTGGFGSETVVGGSFCCPPEFRSAFAEEHAVAFTVDHLYTLEAFEFILRDSGIEDSLRIDLSIGSSTDPGGNEPALNFLAPNGATSIETWILTDAISSTRGTFHLDSALRPILAPGELYWISMSPGKAAPFDFLIRAEWVSAEETDPLVQGFGRRNNASGGSIDDVVWTVGASNSARTLRVFATPVPEPPAMLSLLIGLVSLVAVSWRRGREGQKTALCRVKSRRKPS